MVPKQSQTIVGLVGAKSCGKSMIAKTMEAKYGWKRVRFADGVKRMLSALYLTPDQLDGGDKEAPADQLCGATPRWAMQSLGTEWGRRLIHAQLWVDALFRHIERMRWLREFDRVVIDDVRFPNEVEAIRAHGGQIWAVRRPEVEVPPSRLDRIVARYPWLYALVRGLLRVQHPSEVYWWGIKPDLVLDNSGSLHQVLSQVDDLLKGDAK